MVTSYASSFSIFSGLSRLWTTWTCSTLSSSSTSSSSSPPVLPSAWHSTYVLSARVYVREVIYWFMLVECSVYQFESLCRWDKLTPNEQKKKQTLQRHLIQCFNRLIDTVRDTELGMKNDLMFSLKIKLLAVSYFGEKLLNSKYHLMLIF